MCFNRRRNIFTLGEFQNTINPVVARVRAQIKNRQQNDVFERDPFKVQSFNFRYAERPSTQSIVNHNHQTFPLSPSSNHSQSRRLLDNVQATKPFETYFYNNGFNITRYDENNSQAGESTYLRRCKYTEPQTSKVTTTNLSYQPSYRSDNTASSNRQQIDTQRQQWSYKYPSYGTPAAAAAANEQSSNNTNQQKLSAYLERRQAARNNKSTNTSSTSISAVQQRNVKPDRLPQWFCGNEERISTSDAAARARQAARGTSKAMAAAVGTVGRISNTTKNNSNTINNTNKTIKATTTTTNRRLSSGSIGSGFAPCFSNRANVSSWRSHPPTTECYQRNTRGSCSNPVLGKKSTTTTTSGTNNNGTQQTQLRQQHGQRIGELQQRRLGPSTLETMVNRSSANGTLQSRTVVQRCNSCEISINIKGNQPRQPKTENVVIKIESASPFKVVSNTGCGSVASNKATNMRSKRLNDLMSRKTNATTNLTPRTLNITPKASSGTLELNKWQSKHSLSSAATSISGINQRVRNCERFVELEGERLRQRAGTTTAAVAYGHKSNEQVGHVLGATTSRKCPSTEHVFWVKSNVVKQPQSTVSNTSNSARIVPKAAKANLAAAATDNVVTSQCLRNICDQGLTSLQQLRASIDAISTISTNNKKGTVESAHFTPRQSLKRSSTAPQSLCSIRHDQTADHLSRKSSNSTFTLPRQSSFNKTNQRSISPSSARSGSSFRSRSSNLSYSS